MFWTTNSTFIVGELVIVVVAIIVGISAVGMIMFVLVAITVLMFVLVTGVVVMSMDLVIVMFVARVVAMVSAGVGR